MIEFEEIEVSLFVLVAFGVVVVRSLGQISVRRFSTNLENAE
jgi:hypothetical protein